MTSLPLPEENTTITSCFLSVIIPMYNESDRILPTLGKFIDYLNDKENLYEIIMVDDFSTDNTLDVVRQSVKKQSGVVVIKNRFGKGKGGAVKTGVLYSKGEHVLFSDADASTPVYELDNLFQKVQNGYAVVIASRALPSSHVLVHQPFYREWMGKTFNFIVQNLLVPGIHDTQCGFKLFTKSAAQNLFAKQQIYGFCFDVEILYLARKNGYKIKEVPVDWINSSDSRIRLFADSAMMFLDLLKIRFRKK